MAIRSRCACGNVKRKGLHECAACFDKLVQKNLERIRRINERLDDNECIIDTAFGKYRVLSLDHNFVAKCGPVENPKSWLSQRSFHLHAGHLPELEKQLGIHVAAA